MRSERKLTKKDEDPEFVLSPGCQNQKLGSGGIHLGINYLVLNETKRYE
jgi:hypothetical protein